MNPLVEEIKRLMAQLTEAELVVVKDYSDMLIDQIQFENEDTLDDSDDDLDDEEGDDF